ncbi:hypothetical protein B0I35DRAFT_475790 [Stachybotrys elegans]|uniref:Uncharacterized protein n=1 Tax=Stachybotrys elegans TaxID=80388 RepID=A0A8K0SZ29_9HYPO|nr:hypothetical protein B0I35DRAFT_475790 [Stachybotrys elegans]
MKSSACIALLAIALIAPACALPGPPVTERLPPPQSLPSDLAWPASIHGWPFRPGPPVRPTPDVTQTAFTAFPHIATPRN